MFKIDIKLVKYISFVIFLCYSFHYLSNAAFEKISFYNFNLIIIDKISFFQEYIEW